MLHPYIELLIRLFFCNNLGKTCSIICSWFRKSKRILSGKYIIYGSYGPGKHITKQDACDRCNMKLNMWMFYYLYRFVR